MTTVCIHLVSATCYPNLPGYEHCLYIYNLPGSVLLRFLKSFCKKSAICLILISTFILYCLTDIIKSCLNIFVLHLRVYFISRNGYSYKRKKTLAGLLESNAKRMYSSLKSTASLFFLHGFKNVSL